mmetsp:Transcript_35100/g.73103  ORF Transcript_35100/g.73103 Transcript_35100/m.73103 type:complete len:448 (+) Transcript_35100:278-1621(+)
MERLRHEFLHLTSTSDSKLIIFRKFIHTKNGNDILQRLVILEKLLGSTGNFVVLHSDNAGVKHTGSGIKGIDSGVDTQLSNRTGQHSCSVQVSKGCGRGRIRKIISRHVDSLHRGNGSLGGRGNTFLKTTHISGKSGLVTDSRRNTSKKGGHFRTGLGETENVVHKEQHILVFFITEVLGNGKTGKSDTGAGTWGFVHLPVDKSGLGSIGGASGFVNLNHTTFNHFVVKIISLTGTFTNTGEDRVSSVVDGNVVNKFHNNNGFSYTGTTEKTNLSSLGVRGKEINNLDSGHKNVLGTTLFAESRSGTMQRGPLFFFLSLKDGSFFIDGFSDDVDNTSKSQRSDRHLNGSTGIDTLLSTNQTFRGFHGNGTNSVFSQMLGNFQHQTFGAIRDFHFQSIENLRKTLGELNIHNGSNHLRNRACAPSCSGGAVGANTPKRLCNATGREHG